MSHQDMALNVAIVSALRDFVMQFMVKKDRVISRVIHVTEN